MAQLLPTSLAKVLEKAQKIYQRFPQQVNIVFSEFLRKWVYLGSPKSVSMKTKINIQNIQTQDNIEM